jgi:hypothetical protein
MPGLIMERMGGAREATRTMAELARRLNIPRTPTSPPGLIEADTVDPWSDAGKYALGWTYFCLVLVSLVTITRLYHYWTDKLRQALYKEVMEQQAIQNYVPELEYPMHNMETGAAADQQLPRESEKTEYQIYQSRWSSLLWLSRPY